MLDWLQNNEMIWGAMVAFSAVSFIATLVAVPVFVVRVPPDYFINEQRQAVHVGKSKSAKALVGVGKTLLGLVLIVMGILMLVLPGQGILSILIGLILLEVPGTSALGRWLVRRPPVRRSIDWLRRRAGKEPLNLERSSS